MRLIDLVVNCLKETFHNDDKTVNAENIRSGELALNPIYSNELNNVLLSINKAISRLITAHKIPLKRATVEPKISEEEPNEKNGRIYDISSIKDIRTIKSIFYVDQNQEIVWLSWLNFSSNDIVYIKCERDFNKPFNIIYERKIKNFTEEDILTIDDDLEEVYGLSDELCNYINYFAKSELFEDRDPDRCKRYLNYFEAFISEVNNGETFPHQDQVRPKYRIRR